ncbi:aromatic/alkene monooxygenase hydroxylase subunit beta [Saccharopolyspora sp. HNM0983]|uniref:propane 2-monooxygenase n=1 Tax=Saccharopolyspora montiporae TaxID=2781240 RepID=A0A929B8V5_9PSEU|nr:aromatic/alkene monooxygenase hydroxylase subunit beta [Saccharopolyspora sp. HNM0983]MBE9375379.1 aromatic/alkene monooxygenase hydroxylase subunit beta [Saccharopolyspora sp. HNM0983]
MAIQDKSKQRSFPQPEFTDAEAGAVEFPSSQSRSFNYFAPKKKRATVYEDVTVDVQPDTDRYLSQGWIYAFRDGPGGYPLDWTNLKSSDWHAFRDPNEEWEQTIYRNNSNVVRQVQNNLANAKTANAYAGWSRGWTRFVEQHLGAWMHAENGLGMHVFVAAQRSGPTNMINTAIAVNSAHKLRFAQDLALYNLDLSESVDGFDGTAHRDVWQSEPIWQPTRELVENLTAIEDWGEALFATNIVFESLIGVLFRSHLVMQIAARNGDYVTPTIVGTGENDYERDLKYTRELCTHLTGDTAHGPANREVLQRWADKWTPMCRDAAHELQPIWSQPQEKVITFRDSWDKAVHGFRSILATFDLDEPKELTG